MCLAAYSLIGVILIIRLMNLRNKPSKQFAKVSSRKGRAPTIMLASFGFLGSSINCAPVFLTVHEGSKIADKVIWTIIRYLHG